MNESRVLGHSGNALQLDGGNDWMNLDPNNTGYLSEAFEGRTFMTWMKINPNLYAGPSITQYKNLAAHFPFNLGFGKIAYDSNYDQLEGSLMGDTIWSDTGKYDDALVFQNAEDYLAIPAKDSLSDLHEKSFSLSLWVNPDQVGEKFSEGKLHAFSFSLENSDYYFEDIENLLALQPPFSSTLEDEESINLNTFSPLDIAGLTIWMDASNENSFDINQTNNAILEWNNSVIGQGYNFNMSWGDPTRKFSAGKWTVNFDGNDMLGTDTNYGSNNYTVFAISRQTGNDNQRLISSAQNWLFGYHNGGNNRFHYNGWLYSGPDASDTNWHLHTSTMSSLDQGSTWKDLVPGIINGSGAHDTWANPGRIRFGGWRGTLANNSETSEGEVSAFLLYNSVLSSSDRTNVEFYLANKWNMMDQLEFDFNRKLNLSGDSDFFDLQLSNQNSYQNALTLFTGVFEAKETGSYQWEILNIGEQAALWLDQNQNGYFESEERLLFYRGENQNSLVISSLELLEGNYSIAIYHAVTGAVPSIEVRFATPTSASGPPSLTIIHPSAQNQLELFKTSNRSSLVRRGPIQLGLNGDGSLFFRYINQGNILLVESTEKVSQADWSQIGVSVDDQNSSIQLFINGLVVADAELPEGIAADLSDSLFWNIGGRHPLEKDYFYGKIDDLRFYKTALTEVEMATIYSDDISGQPIVGSRKQVIFDEGTDSNGILLVNDEGTLRAQVIENATVTELNTTKLIEDTANELPFTPLQEEDWGIQLWLDADDLESMDQGTTSGALGPPNSGQSIGFWRDKSLSGYHAKVLTGAPKWLNDGFNEKSCVDLTNDSFYLENSANSFEGWEDIVIFATLYQTAFNHFSYILGKGTQTGWLNNNSHSFSWALNMHRADINSHKIWGPAINTATGGNAYLRTSSDVIWTHDGFNGGPSLLTIRYSSNNSSGLSHNLVMKVNGSQFLQGNVTGPIKSTSTTPVTIGGTGSGGGTWVGRISEVIISNQDLGIENIEIFEGYLAHKWGLNMALPSDHGYFSSAPIGSRALKKANDIDTDWHHIAVSYGEPPRTLKLYLDGQLASGPVTANGTGVIPSHNNVPSVGNLNGSFALDEFGAFLGSLDDIRVYDRGLSADEIAQVFAGDANQSGLVEYRVVEKPQINTLPAMEARPRSVILRADLKSIGGEIIEEEISLGETFDQNTIPGIQAWFDAEQISAQNGQVISRWQDQSGRPNQDRSFTNVSGSPRLLSFTLNGNPAVSFDGEDDQMWTGYDFNSLLHQTGYTIITIARYSGAKNNQIITSRHSDFYFGFHRDGIGVWRAGGDISLFGDSIDNDWHLHLGTISDNSGDPKASFWQDGVLKVFESRESDNQTFGPGQLQIGGKGSENSTCEVAEILIYSGELNPLQRSTVEGYLAHKWNLQKEVLPEEHPYAILDPFGLQVNQTISSSVGGDPAEVVIFWGNERIESNSTTANPDDNSSWDYRIVLNESADIGTFETTINENLEENTLYYFRAYAKNIAGANWAEQILTFKTIDTQFTKHSMDGLILWLDASDIDGNGERDSLIDQTNIPIWVDKSVSSKDATQTIINQMPTYERTGFGSLPSVKFSSGQSMKVGTLSNLSGPINIFASAYGDGVIMGGDDG
ncbi:MAG: LamG-like jellyroll fold domain-containing protein, partial [Opitutae bacterium]